MDSSVYEKFVLDAANKAVEIIDARNSEVKPEEKLVLDNHIQTYTIKEVSALTNRCGATIRNHIKASLLIAKKGGKNWIITQENLNKYIGKQ